MAFRKNSRVHEQFVRSGVQVAHVAKMEVLQSLFNRRTSQGKHQMEQHLAQHVLARAKIICPDLVLLSVGLPDFNLGFDVWVCSQVDESLLREFVCIRPQKLFNERRVHDPLAKVRPKVVISDRGDTHTDSSCLISCCRIATSLLHHVFQSGLLSLCQPVVALGFQVHPS